MATFTLTNLLRSISDDDGLSSSQKGALKDLVVAGRATQAAAELERLGSAGSLLSKANDAQERRKLLRRQPSDEQSRAMSQKYIFGSAHIPFEKMGKKGEKKSKQRLEKEAHDALQALRSFGAVDAAAAAAADDDGRATLSKQGRKEGEWVVTEKVHGANFAFISDGKKVVHASRRRLLKKDDDFFGSKSSGLLELHDPRVLRLVALVRKRVPADGEFLSPPQYYDAPPLCNHELNSTLAVVWVYGELFGGGFPGLETEPGCVLVQASCAGRKRRRGSERRGGNEKN